MSRTRFRVKPHSAVDIQATIECEFTMKSVRAMTRTCSQINRTDMYSQHSSIT